MKTNFPGFRTLLPFLYTSVCFCAILAASSCAQVQEPYRTVLFATSATTSDSSSGDIVIFYECDDYTTNKIAILSPEWLFEN